MNSQNSRREFDIWLVFLDDYIDEFRSGFPSALKEKLDYSPFSLDIVEIWLLEKYSSSEMLRQRLSIKDDLHIFMCAMSYVGETYRINLGGKWNIHFDNPDEINGRLQVIERFNQENTSLCPSLLMLSALDKRSTAHISTVLMFWMAMKQKHEGSSTGD
jgi:hypothetical protein